MFELIIRFINFGLFLNRKQSADLPSFFPFSFIHFKREIFRSSCARAHTMQDALIRFVWRCTLQILRLMKCITRNIALLLIIVDGIDEESYLFVERR